MHVTYTIDFEHSQWISERIPRRCCRFPNLVGWCQCFIFICFYYN